MKIEPLSKFGKKPFRMTDDKKKLFKKIIKDAKSQYINNVDDFESLIAEKYYDDDITGGEFECLLQELKIKRF